MHTDEESVAWQIFDMIESPVHQVDTIILNYQNVESPDIDFDTAARAMRIVQTPDFTEDPIFREYVESAAHYHLRASENAIPELIETQYEQKVSNILNLVSDVEQTRQLIALIEDDVIHDRISRRHLSPVLVEDE